MIDLRLSDVHVRYDGVHAVRGVSLRFDRPAFVGIVGPNGAGKSTLMNAIAGTAPLAGGRVDLDGGDLSGKPKHLRARLGIGRTFQDLRMAGQMTVYENVSACTIAGGVPVAAAWKALTECGADAFADRRFQELSYGDQKKVVLANVMALSPRVVLLDEPFSGLTEGETDWFCGLIHRVFAGKLVLCVEHNLQALCRMSERLVVMNFGQVIGDGRPDEVLQLDEVRKKYLMIAETA